MSDFSPKFTAKLSSISTFYNKAFTIYGDIYAEFAIYYIYFKLCMKRLESAKSHITTSPALNKILDGFILLWAILYFLWTKLRAYVAYLNHFFIYSGVYGSDYFFLISISNSKDVSHNYSCKARIFWLDPSKSFSTSHKNIS